MPRKNINDDCGPGKILRKGYYRKGYRRKRHGKSTPDIYVSSSYVPPACIRDMGKPGKGLKTLPKLDDKIHLTKYGYGIHKSDKYRRTALKAASRDYGVLPVLRRLNLIRNYQAVPENKKIFTRDVEYLKNMYSRIKKKRQKNMKGGNDDGDKSSDTSDITVDYIDLPKKEKSKTTYFYQNKECEKDTCIVARHIYERHEVDGKEIIFYTIEANDIKEDTGEILKLAESCLTSQQEKENLINKIKKNLGLIVGIKINDKLQGYCQYEPLNDNDVMITYFCGNKGYRSPLYLFMSKFLKLSGYDKIILDIDKSDKLSQELDFWHRMGFEKYEPKEFKPIKNKIYLVKNL